MAHTGERMTTFNIFLPHLVLVPIPCFIKGFRRFSSYHGALVKGLTTFDISFSPRLVPFLFLHFHKRLRGFSSHQFLSFKQATGNASVHWFPSNTLPRDIITAITFLYEGGHSTRALFKQRQRPSSII